MALRSRLSLLLVAALHASLLACGPDKDPLDSVTNVATGNPTGSPSGGSDPSGDPSGGTDTSDSATDDTGSVTSGMTSGVTTGETGGAGGHPACDQYIECLGAVSPESVPEAEMAFGPNSSCWQLTPDIEQMCIESCQMGLSAYAELYPEEPACGGSGGTTTNSTDVTDSTTDITTDSTTTTGSGSNYGNCGWNDTEQYYACDIYGGLPGEPDPGGTPIDCPDRLPAPGDPCDENSPVNGIGCCLPNGDNYYCSADNTIAVDNCGG